MDLDRVIRQYPPEIQLELKLAINIITGRGLIDSIIKDVKQSIVDGITMSDSDFTEQMKSARAVGTFLEGLAQECKDFVEAQIQKETEDE